MKSFRKIAAVAAAAAVVMSMGVKASAVEPINAKLGFTDVNWTYQDWESAVEVTGDGTFTISSTAVAGTEEIGVFVVDLEGMYAAYPEAVATLDRVEIDGNEISFDADKILYGDIEEKGNFRIDVYNMYSPTKDEPPINNATPITESLSITFTVSGLGGDGAAPEFIEDEPAEEAPVAVEEAPVEEAPAPAAVEETVPAATGNASAAALMSVMALAAAAVVVTKKTK